MSSELGQIADAVLLAVNAAQLSQPIAAVRTQNPDFPREELVAMRCLVVPVAVRSRPLAQALAGSDMLGGGQA